MSQDLRRVVGVIAASLVCLFPTAWAQDGASTAPSEGPPPTPVRVAEARSAMLAPRKKVFGELRAARRSTIAAQDGGIVREVAVREGEFAAEGTVLVRLDDTRAKLELAANDASLALARVAVAEREAMHGRTARALELVRRAAAQGGTNPREIADAESGLSIAVAQVAQARAAVTVTEQQGLLLAKKVEDHAVRAPFAGVVTQRHAEVGAWIAEGGAIVDLLGTDRLEAWFEIPQEFLAAADALVADAAKKETRAIPIDIESATGASLVAVGIRVIPEIDPRARTFRAVLAIMKDKSPLAAGLALTAYVPSGERAPRIVVPKDAIIRGDAGPYLYAVRAGIATQVQVRIAFPVGDGVAIEAGAVEAGEQVIIEGNERLAPMTRVAPIASVVAETDAAQKGTK